VLQRCNVLIDNTLPDPAVQMWDLVLPRQRVLLAAHAVG